jgi:hypothetical protein
MQKLPRGLDKVRDGVPKNVEVLTRDVMLACQDEEMFSRWQKT